MWSATEILSEPSTYRNFPQTLIITIPDFTAFVVLQFYVEIWTWVLGEL